MTPDGTDGLEGEPTDDVPLWLSRHPQWDGSLSGCFNRFLLNATCGRKQIKTDWVCWITLGWPLGVYSMTDFSEFPVTLQFYCPAAFSLLLLSVPLRFEHLHSALLQHALFPFNVSAVVSWLVLILQHQLLIIAQKNPDLHVHNEGFVICVIFCKCKIVHSWLWVRIRVIWKLNFDSACSVSPNEYYFVKSPFPRKIFR